MSRPWNRSLHLRVGPDQVEAALRSAWPRRSSLVSARRDVDPGAGARLSGTGPLAEAIEAVLQDVAAKAPLKGVRLNVELASALVHLDVVEGDFGALADRQLQGVADACVVELLGDEAAGHEVRWHLQHRARHMLVVAMARGGIAILEGIASSAGMRLRSVQPEFVARWNEFGRALKGPRCVFVVSTSGDLSIGTVVDGTLSSISTCPGVDMHQGTASETPTSPDGGAALDARVDRLLFCSGQDPQEQSQFVLVAAGVSSLAPSSRWVLASAAGGSA